MKIAAATIEDGGIAILTTSTEGKHPWKCKTESFAKYGRQAYVQKMTVAKLGPGANSTYICVARKGGTVELYNSQTFEKVKEWKNGSRRDDDPFIALDFAMGRLTSCAASGKVIIHDLSPEEDTDEGAAFIGEQAAERRYLSTFVDDHGSLSAFRMHPLQLGIAAYGGKERDLELVQLFPNYFREGTDSMEIAHPATAIDHIVESADEVNAANDTMERLERITRLSTAQESPLLPEVWRHIYGLTSHDLEDSGMGSAERPHLISRTQARPGHKLKIWKARNIDTEAVSGAIQPVWISDIQFYDVERPASEGWSIAVATRYGEIKLYEAKARGRRRPLCTTRITDHPLHNIKLIQGGRLIWSDGFRSVGTLYGRAQYKKRFTGAPRGFMHIQLSANEKVLVGGGMDKAVRFYDFETGLEVGSAHTGSYVSGLCIVEGDDNTDACLDEELVVEDEADSDEDHVNKKRRM